MEITGTCVRPKLKGSCSSEGSLPSSMLFKTFFPFVLHLSFFLPPLHVSNLIFHSVSDSCITSVISHYYYTTFIVALLLVVKCCIIFLTIPCKEVDLLMCFLLIFSKVCRFCFKSMQVIWPISTAIITFNLNIHLSTLLQIDKFTQVLRVGYTLTVHWFRASMQSHNSWYTQIPIPNL